VTLGELLAGIDAELLPAEFEQALAELRGAAERAPGDARGWGEVGALLDAHGLYAAAERVYGRAAELDPRDARLRALMAFAQAEQGRLAEALASLEAAIALAPERAHLRVRRGLWLAEFGRAEEAAKEFARALELAPDESAAVLAWARLDLDLGNSAAAEQRLRARLAVEPADLPARALLARALTDLGQTEAAAAERALAGPALPSWSDPWKAEVEARAVGYGAVMGAALEALRSGQAEARLADVQRLHAADPDDVTVQGMLTAALISLGRAGEAVEMLRQAQERQPDHYRIPMNLALALDALGQTREALAPAERAAMLHPGLPDAQRLLGRLHSKLEAPALAAAAYQRAVELGDRDAKSMELLAMALRRAGRGPEARPWFLEVAALSPGRARPRAFAALCLAEAGDLATARREFDAAAALEPKEPVLASLGRALAQLEQRSGR
jgi:Flp pilus assembly protein TadD